MREHPITDIDITEAMQRFGGDFARALAVAFVRADDDNRERIRTAFPEMWAQYTEYVRLRGNRTPA